MLALVVSEPARRTESSTDSAICSICVALIPRPLVAASTPLTILARSNGSVDPSDLTTVRGTSSTRSNVVKRCPHDGHLRRRRTAAPSLARRESTTLVSSAWHIGQCTAQGYATGDIRLTARRGARPGGFVALPAPQRHAAPRRRDERHDRERPLGRLTTIRTEQRLDEMSEHLYFLPSLSTNTRTRTIVRSQSERSFVVNTRRKRTDV